MRFNSLDLDKLILYKGNNARLVSTDIIDVVLDREGSIFLNKYIVSSENKTVIVSKDDLEVEILNNFIDTDFVIGESVFRTDNASFFKPLYLVDSNNSGYSWGEFISYLTKNDKSDPTTEEGFVYYSYGVYSILNEVYDNVDDEYKKYIENELNSKHWYSKDKDLIYLSLLGILNYIPFQDSTKKQLLYSRLKNHLTDLFDKSIESVANVLGKDKRWLDKFDKTVDYFTRYTTGTIETSFLNQNKKIVDYLVNKIESAVSSGLTGDEVVSFATDNLLTKIQSTRDNWQILTANNTTTLVRERALGLAYDMYDIQYVRVRAVLDNRTSAICRFLDGEIIDVKLVNERWDTIEAEGLDVTDGFRWLGVSKEGDLTNIHIDTTDKGRVILASGKGDNLKWNTGLNMSNAVGLGVGYPPYHAHCRSTVYYDEGL